MRSNQVLIGTSSLLHRPSLLEQVSWMYKLPLAFLAGGLLGLSCAGFDIWWLAWFLLAPLLILLRACHGKLEAAMTGLCFGLGYHCVSLSWLLGLAPLSWLGVHKFVGIQLSLLIWAVESLHQALLIAALSLVLYCLPMRSGFLPNIERPFYPALLTVPVIWVFLQWIVAPSELFIGTPINQLAYSQYRQLPLIQMSAILGSGCLDFLIVLTNVAIANVVLEFTKWAPRLGRRTDNLSPRFGSLVDLAVVGILIAVIAAWGANRVAVVAAETDVATAMERNPQTPPVPVAVVQANVSVEEEKLKITKPDQITRRYITLCNNVGAAILFLPEGVINASQMGPGGLLSLLKGVSQKQEKEVVVGSIETLQNGLANAARIISPFAPKDDLYLKRRLVPLGEFAPLSLTDRIPTPVRERIPATRETFLRSQATHLMGSGWGKIGMSIHVELIYPRLIASEVRHGASLLVSVSNLGWFHDASINRQLLAAAVFRAVENGRYMVLATNTGVSAVVDPSGMITSSSVPGQRGILLNTIQFLYRKTPFSKMWWL